MGEEKQSILERLTLEDKIAASIILAVGIFLLILVSGFQHIPGPIYGGDFYMARGFTQAILNGQPVWNDPFYEGGYAYYGWLSYLLTAAVVRLTGMSLERVSVILPAFLHMAYLFACYLLGSALFKSKKYGLFFMLAAFAFKVVDMKISGHLAAIFMLLALYCFVRYEQVGRGEPGSRKGYGLMMGLFMGLTALSHVNIFFGLMVLVCGAIAFEYLSRLWRLSFTKTTLHFVRRYFFPFLIAIALAMLLIGPWIFYYHMKMLNPAQQYSTQDISKLGIGWVLNLVVAFFFRQGFLQLLVGLLLIFGLLFCILNRKQLEPKLALFWLISAIIGTAHFLITKPLLNTWSVPGYIWGASIWIVELALFVYAIKNIELTVLRIKGSPGARYAVYGIFLVLLIAIFATNLTNFNNDRWTKYGRTMDAGTQVMFDTGDWILANTEKDDVLLANDESSFALSAMSGRYVVMARRTHSNYYEDVDKRYADGIVMLYGSNKTKVEELLRQYNVKYLYLDSFLYSYPMITSTRFEQYLLENGVNFTIADVRLDPAGSDAPVYTSVIVPPQDVRILAHNITEPVKQFLYEGQTHSIILKVLV